MLAVFFLIAAGQPVQQEWFSPPTYYSASYGPYYAEIPVNDPGDAFSSTTSSYDHYQRAQDKARETENDQRDTFWN